MNRTSYSSAMKLIGPYSVIIAAIYSISYWSEFGVDPFQFLTLPQLLLNTVHILVLLTTVALIAITLRSLTLQIGRIKANKNTSAEIKNPTDWEHAIPVIAVTLSTLFGLALLSFDNALSWFFLPPFFITFLILYVEDANLFGATPLSQSTIKPLLAIGIYLLSATAGVGKIEAKTTKSANSGISAVDKNCTTKFAGKLGDFAIFYDYQTGHTIYEPLSNKKRLAVISTKACNDSQP